MGAESLLCHLLVITFRGLARERMGGQWFSFVPTRFSVSPACYTMLNSVAAASFRPGIYV